MMELERFMTHAHTRAAVRVVIVFSLFVLIATAVVAPITFKFSPVKVQGAQASWAYGVNNSGMIVGQYFDHQSMSHGFMLNHGQLTTIDDPNGNYTVCYGINSSGAVVGEYTAPSGYNHGFLYQNGKFTDIGPGAQSGAFGINDMGDIVGTYLTCNTCQEEHAFLWNGHKYKRLDVPGAPTTGAVGINKQGVIALIALHPSGPARSYLYQQGKFTQVKVPGATQTYIADINNFGDLVLTWDNQNGIHGALRYQGQFYKFDYTPNYTNVYGLNDHHLIVGDSFSSSAFKAVFKPAVTPNSPVE